MCRLMGPTIINALPLFWLLALLPALVVQVYAGRAFYSAAWSGLRHGNANMSLLVALGTTAALTYSVVSVVSLEFNKACS